MKQLGCALLVLLMLVLFENPAQAGRPLNTDDAGVVPVGTLEVEAAYEYANASDKENNLSLVFTTGLLETLDIGVEIPYQFIDVKGGDDEEGLSDISVTTKWNFLSDEDLFDATISFSYKSDNGDDEDSLGTGETEFTILGIISKEVSDMAFHLNLGPTILDDGEDVLNYNVAAEWGVAEKTGIVGELFGSHNLQDDFDDNSFSGLVGLTHQVRDNAVFDLGITLGISDVDPDFKITTGITVEFP